MLLDAPPRSVIIGDDGTVDAATAGTQPLKAQSIKDGFTAAAATMGDNLEGGSPGLPRDPVAFPLAFRIVGQLVSVFAGFHTFMNAVKRPQDSVLVPAADGRGTNAVLRRPAGLFPLRFGNDSFKPHLAAVQVTRKPCVVLSLPGIALDVDSPADLKDLANSPGETRAQRLVRRWDFADYPLAVNG